MTTALDLNAYVPLALRDEMQQLTERLTALRAEVGADAAKLRETIFAYEKALRSTGQEIPDEVYEQRWSAGLFEAAYLLHDLFDIDHIASEASNAARKETR